MSATRKSATTKPTLATAPPGETIIIERRYRVAEIREGEGEHPMLRAAFMAASDAIAENGAEVDHLEFVTHGTRFSFDVSPETKHKASDMTHDQMADTLKKAGYEVYR